MNKPVLGKKGRDAMNEGLEPDVRVILFDSVIVDISSCSAAGALWLKDRLSLRGKSFDDVDWGDLCVESSDLLQDRINYICAQGYHEIEFKEAPLGCTELCMHTQTTQRVPKRVWVNKQRTYAYALLDNNQWLDGCFFQASDETISLS